MPYSPFPVERFGGLNLVADPEEVGAQGAVDLLNVDLDQQGRVRSRDGYDNFTASAAAAAVQTVAPYYKTDGTRQVLASTSSPFYIAYSTAGAVIASQGLAGGITEADFTRFGGPTAEVSYASCWQTVPTLTQPVYKWSGSAWSAATGCRLGGAGDYPFSLEVHATDNRLVGAFPTSGASRVGFSGAGTPETWSANDYVDLTPGDGERITALVSWREMTFAFKETKFFVFTGTSTAGDGTAIFNYRPVTSGVPTTGPRSPPATSPASTRSGEPGADTYIRQTRAWGSGTPTVSVSRTTARRTRRRGRDARDEPGDRRGHPSAGVQGPAVQPQAVRDVGRMVVNRLIHDVAWTRP
jgi:hypothetical protein